MRTAFSKLGWVIVSVIIIAVLLLAGSIGRQSGEYRRPLLGNPTRVPTHPPPTPTSTSPGMSLSACVDFMVEEVLWNTPDTDAAIYICISQGMGTKAECTATVRKILKDVAWDWCIKNR